jgi:hypothetical protein
MIAPSAITKVPPTEIGSTNFYGLLSLPERRHPLPLQD